MTLPNAYRRELKVPEERVALLLGDAPIDVTAVKRGVLFVLARWSGASQLSFRALNALLADAAEDLEICLLVADTDTPSAQQFMQQQGDVPSGNGETYWIKDGLVLGKLETINQANKKTAVDYINLLRSPSESP